MSVGRLVAIAFIPNQNGYKYVKHKDGNVKNNNITNLQWCSKSEYDSRTKTNKYIKINNQTYKLIINNTDEVLFDSEDYNTISSYHWKLNKYGYAYSHHIAMHRLVLNNPDGIVDHIDHNKLNNKKNNLRICTIQENNRNRDKKKSKYGVLGVYPILSKWIARIMHKGIKYNLGTFDTYEEAAVARIEKEIELFGEFSSQKHLLEKYKKLIKE